MIFDAPFVRLPANSVGRDIVVGDIHGQGAMLERLLDRLQFNPAQDRLIALGDLIDRGPDGAELIARFSRDPARISLRGNHEAMMQAAAESRGADNAWRKHDNTWSWQLDPDELDRLRAASEGFPLAIELPLPDGRRVGLVHAEVPPGRSWNGMHGIHLRESDASNDGGRSDGASALWGRRRAIADAWMRQEPEPVSCTALTHVRMWDAAQPVADIELVLSGHTVLVPPLPRGRSNVLWVDTGAGYPDGRLTAVNLTDSVYWQVGRLPEEVWGPLPMPLLDPVLEAWRPTAEIEAAAAKQEAKQLAVLRMLLP